MFPGLEHNALDQTTNVCRFVKVARLEPLTSVLLVECSTTELPWHNQRMLQKYLFTKLVEEKIS